MMNNKAIFSTLRCHVNWHNEANSESIRTFIKNHLTHMPFVRGLSITVSICDNFSDANLEKFLHEMREFSYGDSFKVPELYFIWKSDNKEKLFQLAKTLNNFNDILNFVNIIYELSESELLQLHDIQVKELTSINSMARSFFLPFGFLISPMDHKTLDKALITYRHLSTALCLDRPLIYFQIKYSIPYNSIRQHFASIMNNIIFYKDALHGIPIMYSGYLDVIYCVVKIAQSAFKFPRDPESADQLIRELLSYLRVSQVILAVEGNNYSPQKIPEAIQIDEFIKSVAHYCVKTNLLDEIKKYEIMSESNSRFMGDYYED